MPKTPRRTLTFFLRQLERTGNIRLAAECAGLAKSGIFKRKRRDLEFATACERALATFATRVPSPHSGGEGRVRGLGDPNIPAANAMSGLKTAPGSPGPLIPSRYAGISQLRRLPEGRLTGLGIANFFAVLASTGNIRLAAKAVGVAHSSILWRRRTDPAFAERFAAALDLAQANVECALIQAADRSFGGDWEGDVDPDGARMSVGEALRALQMLQRGGRYPSRRG